MTDHQTRYACWQCGTERWLPERPLSPTYSVRVKCDECRQPMTHHPVGVPGPGALREVVGLDGCAQNNQ